MTTPEGNAEPGGQRNRPLSALGEAAPAAVIAPKLAILIYRMLRHRTTYRQLSAAEYDQHLRSRILRGPRGRAASLGREEAGDGLSAIVYYRTRLGRIDERTRRITGVDV